VNRVKVDAILCKGNVVFVDAENPKSGVKVYIAGEELQLDQLEGFMGRYKIVDHNGQQIPRIPGKIYMQEGAVFILQSNEGEDEDDEESNEWDDDNIGGDDIRSKDVDKAKAVCAVFAENYEKKGKKWKDTINKAHVGIIRNSEYKTLEEVIGYHSTLDAVAKMFGAYFDDDTFKNIATDVIAMYFNNDVDVTATIKELEFRHLNEN